MESELGTARDDFVHRKQTVSNPFTSSNSSTSSASVLTRQDINSGQSCRPFFFKCLQDVETRFQNYQFDP